MKKPLPLPEGALIGVIEIEWLPGAKENAPLLMPAVAKHTAGSEPQSSNPPGAEVRPIEAPKSKTSNRSPA